jgi:hypothetical protein
VIVLFVLFSAIVAAKLGLAWGVAAACALYVLAPYPPRDR